MKNNKMLDEAIIDYKELKQLIEGYVNDTKSSNIVSLLSEILNEDVNTQKDTKEIEESENKDATTQNRIVDIEMTKEIEESKNKDATTQNTNNDEFEVSDIVALIKQEINKEKEVNMKNENEQVLESFKNIIKESLKELMNDKKQIKETEETVEVEDINEDEDIKIYDDEITEDEDITISNDEIEESHGVSLSNNKLVNGNKTPREVYAQYKKNKLRSALQESKRRGNKRKLNESANNNSWIGVDKSLKVSLNDYQYIFKDEGNGEWSVISTVPYKYTYGGFNESDLDDYMNDKYNKDKRNEILSNYGYTFEEWQELPVPTKASDIVEVSDYIQLGISGYDTPMTRQEVADETGIDIDDLEDSINEAHRISLSNNKRAGANTQHGVAYAQYKKNKLRSALQEELKTSYNNRIKLLSESYKKAKQETLAIKNINNKYKDVLVKYRNQLNEMVLYNTKISHINNILVNENLNDNDKINILKQFDKATNVGESEKVYQTLTESFKKEKEVNLKETLKNDMTNVVQTNTTKKLIGEAVESGAYKNDSHINKIKKMFSYMDNK